MLLRRSTRLGMVLLASLAAACSAAGNDVGAGNDNGGGGSALDGGDASDTSKDVAQEPAVDAPAEQTSDAGDASDAPQEAGLCAPDQDLDEIRDDLEGKATNVDTDGDGTPDYLDLDSDDDTIPDLVEGDTKDTGCGSPQDSDGDGVDDYRDTDSDNNGLPDKAEVHPDGTPWSASNPAADTDGDHIPDYADKDNDNDALPDTSELDNGVAIDTDGDGLPDLDDNDSDNDTIIDGQDGTADFDGDGLANFRDPDSDNDGIPDSCEAGPQPHNLSQTPVDTDSDGKYDFADLDSDGDGLLDADEDKNGNCLLDPGETDRTAWDTDGDGVSDLIETLLGSDPNDQFITPQGLGKFFFIEGYQQAAGPTNPQTLAVDTNLQRADVAFVVDHTGSMSGEIQNLQSGLTTMISKLKTAIPDVAIGIGAHDDFPVAPYGAATDRPFFIPNGGMVTSITSDSLAAVGALFPLGDGADNPESQIVAMWRGLTNKAYNWPTGLSVPDTLPSCSSPPCRFGSFNFRPDALTILVGVTDISFHNGRRASAPTTLHDPYTFNTAAPYGVPTVDNLITEMNAKGARFIGLAANDGTSTAVNPRGGDPYADMAYIADQTNSDVPPSAFNGGTCNTGIVGTPLITPDGPPTPKNAGGTCRPVFDVYKSGVGLTDRVVDGVKALLHGLTLDVRVVAVPDDPSPSNGFIDSVDVFVEYVEVSQQGGIDPIDHGACVYIDPGALLDQWCGAKGLYQLGSPLCTTGDTHWETVKSVVPPEKICYNIKANDNFSIACQNKPQVFHAVLQVKAKNGLNPIELDFGAPRDVLFIVPPCPQ